MGKVSISALGPLKEKIPTETEVEITETMSAFELVERFSISRSESRLSFIINGKMEKGNYPVQPGDKIVALKMGGAG